MGINIKEAGSGWQKAGFEPQKNAGEEVSAPDFAPSRKRTESIALGWQREHYLGYLRGVSGRNILVGEFQDSGYILSTSSFNFGNAFPRLPNWARAARVRLGTCRGTVCRQAVSNSG